MSQIKKKCPVCNNWDFSRSYVIRGYMYYSCNSCGVLCLIDKENVSKSSSGKYNEDYFKGALKENMSGYIDYAKQSLPLRMYFRIVLSHIKRHLSFDTPVSLLDVGCAYGFFLDEARKLGMTVHGLDLSEDAIRWMENHLDINGTVGISSDAPEGPFDIITAMEVIEHVQEPRSFVADLHKRIKDNGLLVIHTGATDSPASKLLGRWWWYLNPPDHCIIFSRRALRDLISNSGFDVLEQHILSCHWVGLNNMMLKLARISESPRLGRLASKLPSLPVPVFEYCAQLLIARKRNK
jgi:cyclopropane fatty-acyl-phospholipid synthase-like methyltransferase